MKKSSRIKLVYARYILPPIMLLLTFLAMFIPSYRYVTGGKLNEAMSAFKLMSNSFDAARRVVFAVAEQDAANMLFSRTVLIVIIVFWLMFLLAAAVAVYSAAVGLRYFWSDDGQRTENVRTVFITLIPNRIFLCILEALCIPLTLFPYILSPLYKWIWSERVGMALMAPDALMVAVLGIIVTAVLCIVSAPSERVLDIDVFKKRKAFDEAAEMEQAEYEETETESDEQKERIRRILLGEKYDEENTENTDKTED